MLDTYDALQWEQKENEDEDAEVIGACDSDKKEEEAGEASGDDTADASDSEVSFLRRRRRSRCARATCGKCDSIRRGWGIL